MLFSVEQAFVERDEKRASIKTPAWEAMIRWKGRKKCVRIALSLRLPVKI